MPPADGSQAARLALRPAQRLSWDLSCRECEEATPRDELSDDDLCINCAEDQQAHGLTVRQRCGYGR